MLVVAAAPVAFGQGGPPMITDDPGTPGNGKWENNFAIMMGHELRSPDQPTALIGYFGMQFVY